jgi:hypothetical protein
MKTETASCSETLVTFYQSTKGNIPENSNFPSHRSFPVCGFTFPPPPCCTSFFCSWNHFLWIVKVIMYLMTLHFFRHGRATTKRSEFYHRVVQRKSTDAWKEHFASICKSSKITTWSMKRIKREVGSFSPEYLALYHRRYKPLSHSCEILKFKKFYFGGKGEDVCIWRLLTIFITKQPYILNDGEACHITGSPSPPCVCLRQE